MVDPKLLSVLACPETKEAVALADEDMVARVNAKIEAGGLKDRGGEEVTEKIDGGLVRADGKILYAVRDSIPIMLIDRGIPLDSI